jgi:hypothetical protein
MEKKFEAFVVLKHLYAVAYAVVLYSRKQEF